MNFKDPAIIRKLKSSIDSHAKGLPETNLMEVCGSHTQAVERFGLRKLLPKNINLVSGPGCPVCITPPSVIESAIKISEQGSVITTYGDLARVPCSSGSLIDAKAKGSDVRVVYSISDAGKIATDNPDKTVVHVAIGFETTAQTTAAFLHSSPPENLLILNGHRWFLPAMEFLLKQGDVKIDGYICPGHVSTLVGSDAYKPLSEKYRIPQVIAGFEPVDIMLSILMLIRMLKRKEPGVQNEYLRVVKPGGNPIAMKLMNNAFGQENALWRGLGVIGKTGMKLKKFREHDASKQFKIIRESKSEMPKGCKCADVLKGKSKPSECPLFGKGCDPEKPIGPCMVSVEGSCHNALKYR